MHPIEVERRRHINTMERLDMWRKFVTKREMIQRRRLNTLKETCLLYVDPLIISPSKSEIIKPCCLTLHKMNGLSILGAIITWIKMPLYFTRLNKSEESKIYVAGNFSMDVVVQGDVSCQHGEIINIYHLKILVKSFYLLLS